jgi:hypothetical protein
MESKKKEYKTRILNQITYLQCSINNDETMLDNIKHQGNTPFVLAQIDKISRCNDSRYEKIDSFTKELEDLEKGLLNNKISTELQQEKNAHIEHGNNVIQKRLEKNTIKQEKSDISQTFYKKNAMADRETRWSKKDMQRSYQYYLKNVNSIPAYIQRNLEEMPNNKGYIWKGIMCYGSLPPEKNRPVTMFERYKEGLLIIHEWTAREYKVYHKKNRDKKILYSTEYRKPINIITEPNIIIPKNNNVIIPQYNPPPPTTIRHPINTPPTTTIRPPINTPPTTTIRPPINTPPKATIRPPYNPHPKATIRPPYNPHPKATNRPPYNPRPKATNRPPMKPSMQKINIKKNTGGENT